MDFLAAATVTPTTAEMHRAAKSSRLGEVLWLYHWMCTTGWQAMRP